MSWPFRRTVLTTMPSSASRILKEVLRQGTDPRRARNPRVVGQSWHSSSGEEIRKARRPSPSLSHVQSTCCRFVPVYKYGKDCCRLEGESSMEHSSLGMTQASSPTTVRLVAFKVVGSLRRRRMHHAVSTCSYLLGGSLVRPLHERQQAQLGRIFGTLTFNLCPCKSGCRDISRYATSKCYHS